MDSNTVFLDDGDDATEGLPFNTDNVQEAIHPNPQMEHVTTFGGNGFSTDVFGEDEE